MSLNEPKGLFGLWVKALKTVMLGGWEHRLRARFCRLKVVLTTFQNRVN